MLYNRHDRLRQDYREMLKLWDRPYLSWVVTKGEVPYAEEYLLTVSLRSYALRVDAGVHTVGVIRRQTVRVTLWDSYPHVAPKIRMLTLPPVFHPDWYSKGTYSPSTPWRPEMSLCEYILGMLRTLCYDPAVIDTVTPANYKALEWYQRRREDAPALFPSDTRELSQNDPETVNAIERAAGFDEIVDRWGNGI